MTKSSDADRIEQLESTVAYLSKLVDDLNEVITGLSTEMQGQARTIEALINEVKKLKEKPSAGEAWSPEDEKPPHY